VRIIVKIFALFCLRQECVFVPKQPAGELVDSRVSREGAYGADHRSPVRTLANRTLRVTPLIKVLLLSLGLWAAIWAAVASLASVVLG
jgi:hypothetical protein